MKLIFIIDGLGDTARPSPLELANTPTLKYLSHEAILYKFKAFSDEYFCPRSDYAFAAFLDIAVPERGALEAFGDGFTTDFVTGFKCIFARQDGNIVTDRKPFLTYSEGAELVAELNACCDADIEFRHYESHRFSAACRWASNYYNDPEVDGAAVRVESADTRMCDVYYRICGVLRTSQLAARRRVNTVLFRLPGRLQVFSNAKSYAVVSNDSVICGLGRSCGYPTFKYGHNTCSNYIAEFVRQSGQQTVVLHYDPTDKAAHKGVFQLKYVEIENADYLLGDLLYQVHFSVIAVTGDHPTPCEMREHSAGYSPCLLWGRGGAYVSFTDEAAAYCTSIIGKQLLYLLV